MTTIGPSQTRHSSASSCSRTLRSRSSEKCGVLTRMSSSSADVAKVVSLLAKARRTMCETTRQRAGSSNALRMSSTILAVRDSRIDLGSSKLASISAHVVEMALEMAVSPTHGTSSLVALSRCDSIAPSTRHFTPRMKHIEFHAKLLISSSLLASSRAMAFGTGLPTLRMEHITVSQCLTTLWVTSCRPRRNGTETASRRSLQTMRSSSMSFSGSFATIMPWIAGPSWLKPISPCPLSLTSCRCCACFDRLFRLTRRAVASAFSRRAMRVARGRASSAQAARTVFISSWDRSEGSNSSAPRPGRPRSSTADTASHILIRSDTSAGNCCLGATVLPLASLDDGSRSGDEPV
mmetsp:Transcript_25091/g.48734  ORF Transcript_25091/g.48734 Transcript_25091/m.48734 type:complete len:350 (+) Transcript_25091:189-1238(+)